MFNNRNNAGFMSSFRRKSSAGDESLKKNGKLNPQRQGSWIADGMPAPRHAVVQQVEQKRAENASAVKVQSIVRGKSARFEVDGKKKQKNDENQAAAKIQAIKRGQTARADVEVRRSSLSNAAEASGPCRLLHACTATLQKCTADMVGWSRIVVEGMQDGSSRVFGQSQAMSGPGRRTSDRVLLHAKPKGDSQLPLDLETQLRNLFGKMDRDRDQILSKAEAVEFWGKNFAKINAQAMFNEVDDDNDDTISLDEWLEFWRNVLAQECYSSEDIAEEVQSMLAGGSWVDWQDGRTT